ncbi:MAG: type 4a pilus biogenesis protein PilO [Syntrophobacteria bacterium]
MRQLSTREKLLTTLVAIALVVTLMQELVIAPQRERLHQARRELTAGNQALASLGTKLAGFQAVRQEVLRKEQELAALNRSLSSPAELSQIIHRLTDQARIHGLRLVYVRPEEAEEMTTRAGKPAQFRRSVMEIGIRCRYQELGEFLAALEREHFYVRIAALELERDQAEPRRLDVRLRVAIVVRG